MLVGGMIGHQVQDDSDAAAARLCNQPIERGQVAKLWMNVAVVAYVVAPVLQWRRVDGAQPDCIDSERAVGAIVQIVQVLDDALEIADSVAFESPKLRG